MRDKMYTAIFIGGPRDGEEIDLPSPYPEVNFPQLSASAEAFAKQKLSLDFIKKHVYRRKKIEKGVVIYEYEGKF